MTSTSEVRLPLTPADCDLRDFAFMPLDVVRLRDSDLAATESPEACWAAVLLWAASWHQIPAASLPDDDRVLANLSGYGRVVREWLKVREGALRGWTKCADGRLYHPVVAEKAAEAWQGKLERQWRTECARMKKHFQRHEMAVDLPEFEDWIKSGRPQGIPLPVPGDKNDLSLGHGREIGSKGKGKGQGKGQGQINKEPKGSSSPAKLPTCPYDEIVAVYHEVLPELPSVRVMDDVRKKAIKERWSWVLTTTKPDGSRRASTVAEALSWFKDYFTRVRDNDFLMRRVPASDGHANWRADIEFLMTSRGLKHVLEKTAVGA